ncbi:hypothetical protein HBB16_16720 [Pseudonocardia sp. MCCB 268]|nr:hypothetical protein [Pseudonocardia cytotoxica]
MLRDTPSGSDLPVTIEHDGVPADRRYLTIADTAYFCCLEASQRPQHAGGAPVTVRISEQDATLGGWRSATRAPASTPDLSLARLRPGARAVELLTACGWWPSAGRSRSEPRPAPDDRAVVAPAARRLGAGRAHPLAPEPEPAGVRDQVRRLLRAGAEAYAGTAHAGPRSPYAAAWLD